MLCKELKEPSAAKRERELHEWLRLLQLDAVGRRRAHNALALMLCALGPFWAIATINVVVRYWLETSEERPACVAFLPGSRIREGRQHVRWKEP